MALILEKARVDHGQPEQRGLQRHDALAYGREQARILRHLAHQLMHHLQSHYLADAFGFFLQLGANQRTLFAATEGAPNLFTQLAADIDRPPAVSHRHFLVYGRCRLRRGRRQIRRTLQRAQLFFNVVVIRGRQAVVGAGATPKQEILEQLVIDGFARQVRILRRLARDRLI